MRIVDPNQADDATNAPSASPSEGAARTGASAGGILADLLDAGRAVALALADEQKRRAAREVGALAEAVRCAAQSLDRSDNRAMAAYGKEAADGIDRLSRAIGERSWSQIAGEAEEFARRQPALFALAATAAGFLAGRVLTAPTPGPGNRNRDQPDAQQGDATPARVPASVPSVTGTEAQTETGVPAAAAGA